MKTLFITREATDHDDSCRAFFDFDSAMSEAIQIRNHLTDREKARTSISVETYHIDSVPDDDDRTAQDLFRDLMADDCDLGPDTAAEYLEIAVYEAQEDTATEPKRITIPEVSTWSQAAFDALPYEIRDGVERFWEPGYDYEDPDFWSSYPDVTEDFIAACIMYDKLQQDAD